MNDAPPQSPPPLPTGLAESLARMASRANNAAGVGTLANLAALGHAALYFMLAGPFGSADQKYRIGTGPAGGMAVTYMALAIISFYLTWKLFGLQSAISRWRQSQAEEDLAEVMRRRNKLGSEWKLPVFIIVLILSQIFFG